MIYKSLHVSDSFFPIFGSVFALATVIFTYQAFKRLPRLTLSSGGSLVETGLVAKTFRWNECTEFKVRPMFRVGAIEFRRDGKWVGGLILNQFDVPVGDLCSEMNKWRSRHGV